MRRELIGVPARLAHRGRDQLILHLPQHWPWHDAFDGRLRRHPPPPTAHHPPARPDRPGHRPAPPTAPAAHPEDHRPTERTCRRTVSGRTACPHPTETITSQENDHLRLGGGSGLSAREIADYLGHERVSMTQDVYMSRKATGANARAALDAFGPESVG